MVLADGRVIQANRNEHADLFRVLKGGGNNFGIVTRFDMQAFPASPAGIWDATMIYPAEAMNELLQANFEFTKGLNDTSDAHILPFVSSLPLATLDSSINARNEVVFLNKITAAGNNRDTDTP